MDARNPDEIVVAGLSPKKEEIHLLIQIIEVTH